MTMIGQTTYTLADFAKRVDPEGKIAVVAELLSKMNKVLDSMLWLQGNLPTGHRTTVRTDLPSVTWRLLNYGVQPTKSRTKQIDDACGMLEAYADIDKSLADLNGNAAAFRLGEDKGFLEAMNQEFASVLFYGDANQTPNKFTGFAPRYPTRTSPNVIDAGGTGSANTSAWLVVWDQTTVHGVFPKGSKAGLQFEDKGQVTLQDDAGHPFEGYRTHYKWDCGVTVRDWRYVVRVANIDTATYPTNLADLCIKAIHKVPNIDMGRACFYMNAGLLGQLDIQAMNKSNVFLTASNDPFGETVLKICGVPLYRCDSLLDTEARI